jgi:hypothetical protein
VQAIKFNRRHGQIENVETGYRYVELRTHVLVGFNIQSTPLRKMPINY